MPKHYRMSRLERMFYVLCIMVLLSWFVWSNHATRAALQVNFENGFSQVVKQITPAVVTISGQETVTRSPFEDQFRGTPFEPFFRQFYSAPFGPQFQERFPVLGSGIIVRSSGFILTNNHVVNNVRDLSVMLSDGTIYRDAKVVGTDPKLDLAVVRIQPKASLPVGILGDSDNLSVGEWAIAVGNPYGFSSTVTVGVISALGRNLPGQSDTAYSNLIQTDASINPGNSGGPLVDIYGKIIGINTIIESPVKGSIGLGFAIPINTAKGELAQLIEKGSVVHGWLGVYIQSLTPELEKTLGVQSGVLISDVVSESPAETAGLMRGDVITRINGKAIHSAQELQNLIAVLPIGEKAAVEATRKKKSLLFHPVITEVPKQAGEPAVPR